MKKATYYTVYTYFSKGVKVKTISFKELEFFLTMDKAIESIKEVAEKRSDSCVLVAPNTLALSVNNHDKNDLQIVEIFKHD